VHILCYRWFMYLPPVTADSISVGEGLDPPNHCCVNCVREGQDPPLRNVGSYSAIAFAMAMVT